MQDLFPAFKERQEGQSALPALAVSQVTLIQNDQYVKMSYFGSYILLFFTVYMWIYDAYIIYINVLIYKQNLHTVWLSRAAKSTSIYLYLENNYVSLAFKI